MKSIIFLLISIITSKNLFLHRKKELVKQINKLRGHNECDLKNSASTGTPKLDSKKKFLIE
jgi:hypothetical protein